MEFQRRTAQLLHEDHQATVAIFETLEDMIVSAKRSTPDTTEASIRTALEQAIAAIDEEVSSHFAFEENELFTRLEDLGDTGIGEHLREEHQAILPISQQVAKLARRALEDGFSEVSWLEFRSQTGELIERMFAHIQKEEMALLPMLDDILDPETDMQLSENYTSNH